MARFDIPAGWTVQAYRFALDPTSAQERALNSHAGARLFAFNTMLAAVKATSISVQPSGPTGSTRRI